MTMPHLMNCSHSPDGWCLGCVKSMHSELEAYRTALQIALDRSWDGPMPDRARLQISNLLGDYPTWVCSDSFTDLLTKAVSSWEGF